MRAARWSRRLAAIAPVLEAHARRRAPRAVRAELLTPAQ